MGAAVAVIIPTIRGREHLLERTKQGWRDSLDMDAGDPPLRIVTVRDRPTIGEAWREGLSAAIDQSDTQWFVLAADDAYPEGPGWFHTCAGRAKAGVYPSPVILNADGTLHSAGTMGAGMLIPGPVDTDDAPAGTSPFPFLTRPWALEVWDAGIPDVHYYADDWCAWLLRYRRRVDCRTVGAYRLVHLEGTHGRREMQMRSAADRAVVLGRMASDQVPA